MKNHRSLPLFFLLLLSLSSLCQGKCFLEKEGVIRNKSACSAPWIVITSILFGCLVYFIVKVCVTGNLYRTPWTTPKMSSMEVEGVGRVQLDEFGKEDPEELPNMCERCGSGEDIEQMKTVADESVTLYICRGCASFKVLIGTFYLDLLLLPVSILTWLFAFELPVVFFLSIFCIYNGAILFVLRNSIKKYMFARREATHLHNTDGDWVKLEDPLDTNSQQMLDNLPNQSHAGALRNMLKHDEVLLFVEKVPFMKFLVNNHTILQSLWVIIGSPLILVAIFFYFWEIDFGLALFFGFCFSIPLGLLGIIHLVFQLTKCSVTYAMTNKRVMRVNTSIGWFADRVYSFPYSRMTFLHTLKFPTESDNEGLVAWVYESSRTPEVFGCFEYVSDMRRVEAVIMMHKTALSVQNQEEFLAEEQASLEFWQRHWLALIAAGVVGLVVAVGFALGGYLKFAVSLALGLMWMIVLSWIGLFYIARRKNFTSKIVHLSPGIEESSV